MFPLRMTHPKHGATHAYDNTEMLRLKQSGWAEEAGGDPEVKDAPKRGRPKKVIN